jgi:hypothetical protein
MLLICLHHFVNNIICRICQKKLIQSFLATVKESESNSIEAKLEISLNDRTFTILSTASLPIRRSIHNHEIESTSAPNHNNEIIYQLYQQRLTNKSPNSKKRSLTKPLENSNIKKSKPSQQPEIIVLD